MSSFKEAHWCFSRLGIFCLSGFLFFGCNPHKIIHPGQLQSEIFITPDQQHKIFREVKSFSFLDAYPDSVRLQIVNRISIDSLTLDLENYQGEVPNNLQITCRITSQDFSKGFDTDTLYFHYFAAATTHQTQHFALPSDTSVTRSVLRRCAKDGKIILLLQGAAASNFAGISSAILLHYSPLEKK